MSMFGFVSRNFNASTYRENVNHGNIPSKSSVSIEGLFNEYYFATGVSSTNDLVSPSFLVSRSVDPITGDKETYVAVGCNCRDDGKNFRNPQNIVFVLDISGSMSGGLGSDRKSKMDVANQVIVEAIKILKPNERVGIVLFDDRVEVLQPIRRLDQLNVEDLCQRVLGVQARNATNIELGYETGLAMMLDMLKEESDQQGYDHRVILLTDANPNVGSGEKSITGLINRAIRSSIYTTIIGVGIDFNTDLVDKLTKAKGSNYFAVHSAKEFKKILNEDFNYIVTPVAFDVSLFMESESYQIDKVYGTPYDNDPSVAIMKVDTVTASPKDERGAKGGVVLLKLKDKLTSKENPSKSVTLTLIFHDRDDKQHRITTEFNLEEKLAQLTEEKDGSVYENTGIRKAILLVRYVNIMHQLIDTLENAAASDRSDGIVSQKVNKNKAALELPSAMKDDVVKLIKHFKDEISVLSDNTLMKEVDVLDKLRYSHSGSSVTNSSD